MRILLPGMRYFAGLLGGRDEHFLRLGRRIKCCAPVLLLSACSICVFAVVASPALAGNRHHSGVSATRHHHKAKAKPHAKARKKAASPRYEKPAPAASPTSS